MKNKIIILFVLLSFSGFSQIVRTLPLVNNTPDSLKPVSKATNLALLLKSDLSYTNQKLHTVSSISALQAYTQSSSCQFDGSVWNLIPGNVASNGGSYAGTIINVSTSFYWKRLVDIVTPQMFGAKGDGITDDTQSIKNCINSFTQTSGGGSVFIKEGIYIVTASIIVDVDGMTIRGVKGKTWLKRGNNAAFGAMNVMQTGFQGRYASGSQIFDFTMSGIGLDGNKDNNPVGTDDNWDHCFAMLYASRSNITNCYFKNATRMGIAISNATSDVIVSGCYISDCLQSGLYAESSTNIIFSGNTITRGSTVLYAIGSISMQNIKSGTITGNTVTEGEDGIYIRNYCDNIAITGNTIRSMSRYGIWLHDESDAYLHTPTNITITGNTTYQNVGYSLYLQLSKNVNVNGNTFNNLNTDYSIAFNNCVNQTFANNIMTGFTVKGIRDPLNPSWGNSFTKIYGYNDTWTPVIIGTTTAGTGTYTKQIGTYTYIGNEIEFKLNVATSNHTGTGNSSISIPFQPFSTDDVFSNQVIIYNISYAGLPIVLHYNGHPQVVFPFTISSGNLASLPITPTGNYIISGKYKFSEN